MSLIDHTGFAEPLALNPNRNDAVGLALSAALPLAALVSVEAGASALGWAYSDLQHLVNPALPEGLSLLLIAVMLPLLGLARWAAWQEGRKGRVASWWVVGLIAAALAYPVMGLVLDGFLMGWLELSLVVLAGAATLRVAGVSRPGLLCMVLPLLAVAAAAIPGYIVLTGGWSPGLAITVAMAHPERL